MPDQDFILQAVKAKLIADLPEATENVTWIDDAPLPYGSELPHFGDHMFSISASDGHYPDEESNGGSLCFTHEESGCVVTHMRRLHLDNVQELDQAIAVEKRAMFKMKPRIISSILIDHSETGFKKRWQPLFKQGKPLFVNQIRITASVAPKRHQNWPMLYQYFAFRYSFRLDV